MFYLCEFNEKRLVDSTEFLHDFILLFSGFNADWKIFFFQITKTNKSNIFLHDADKAKENKCTTLTNECKMITTNTIFLSVIFQKRNIQIKNSNILLLNFT